MTALAELPSDGIITRSEFNALPTPARGWAWELRDGRLELTHMPVTVWHSEIVRLVLEYWRRLGHVAVSEQYVADSGFVRGGTGKNNYVADGVVFIQGHTPGKDTGTHDAADVHAVIEAVSARSEEKDAISKFATYAALGVRRYWIVRDAGTDEVDGLVTMYELIDGEYQDTGHRMVSQLAA